MTQFITDFPSDEFMHSSRSGSTGTPAPTSPPPHFISSIERISRKTCCFNLNSVHVECRCQIFFFRFQAYILLVIMVDHINHLRWMLYLGRHDICQNFYPIGVFGAKILHKNTLVGIMANSRQNSVNLRSVCKSLNIMCKICKTLCKLN